MTKLILTKPLLLIILVLMFVQPIFSSNFMGGEITWECTPQGNFRFTMKLYRECYNPNGTAPSTFPTALNLSTNITGMTSIGMTCVGVRDLTPGCGCPNGTPLSCTGMTGGTANLGALEEWVFTSDNAYPTGVPLTGIPPSQGWRFSYSGCCRSTSTNIIGTPGFCIQSWMFPYQNTPVNNCFDHSPKFMESPAGVGYTQQPYSYNTLVYDQDGDQTVFGWSTLYTNPSISLTDYAPGYSFTSPLPGVIHDPNNTPATLNQATGLIDLQSYTSGAFSLALIATSYKNGIKVAQIFRDIKIILLPATTNNPPVYQISPNLTQVKLNHYKVSVEAGDSISFVLHLNDQDTCPGSSEPNRIWLSATGEQFATYITGSPCMKPPCAALSPSPTTFAPLTGITNLTTQFGWRTSFSHVESNGNTYLAKKYPFIFEYQDNHCQHPAKGRILVEVDVIPGFLKNGTHFSCISIEPNGDVLLQWRRSLIPDSQFVRYEIYASIFKDGPYALHTQIHDPNITSFIHHTPTQVPIRYFYKIITHFQDFMVPNLQAPEPASSTLLTVTPFGALAGKVQLSWNETYPQPMASASGIMEVYRDDGNGIWQHIANSTGTGYLDQLPFLNQFVRYKVERMVNDTTGAGIQCKTVSNVATTFLNSMDESEQATNRPIIFPNPNRGTFALDPGSLEGEATIRIIASNGTIVHQANTILIPYQPCTLETPGLAAGIYWVHIVADQGEYTLFMKNE